jgi:hypothetical protein
VVILLTVRGPIYLQTHSETYTHGNSAVLQKRPESYQNNVKNLILPKENMKIWLYRAISQETSAAVNRKKKQRSYTSYTIKQEQQEQKQRLNSTYMYILSDIYVISVVEMLKCLNDHIYNYLYFDIPSSLKQQTMGRHVAPL